MIETVDPSPLLMSSKEAAKALNISPRLLWTLTDRGDLPVVRIGTRVLYAPDDLKAYIADQKGGRP